MCRTRDIVECFNISLSDGTDGTEHLPPDGTQDIPHGTEHPHSTAHTLYRVQILEECRLTLLNLVSTLTRLFAIILGFFHVFAPNICKMPHFVSSSLFGLPAIILMYPMIQRSCVVDRLICIVLEAMH